MPTPSSPIENLNATSVGDVDFNAPARMGAAEQSSPKHSDPEGYASQLRTQQFAILWYPLITAMVSATDQNATAEACVKHFAEMLPDHTIRLGWASDSRNKDTNSGDEPTTRRKLHRLYDSRLGWMGNDNTVYQALDLAFQKIAPAQERIRWNSANLILECVLPTTESTIMDGRTSQSRVMIWIRPPQSNEEELKRFAAVVPGELLSTIASIFFSRPVSGRWGKFLAFAKKWYARRASLGIAAIILMAIICIPTRYRIDARASVIAMNARMVASPIDATLLTAHVRPGDLVKQGQALLELDGRPLRIELEALTAEIDEATKDEDIALAGGEIAQAQLAGLRRQTLTRRRDLIADRLGKLIVTSPIDGVVIQGDLQHSLGTPLEIGQTLLEIAPSDSVEIELEVPEVEIGYVDQMTPVQLWFPAVGQTRFETTVAIVYPSATIREDENVFIAMTPMPGSNQSPRLDAAREELSVREVSDRSVMPADAERVTASASSLRVGMRGEAVLIGPTRPWIWKWVRVPIRRLGWILGW